MDRQCRLILGLVVFISFGSRSIFAQEIEGKPVQYPKPFLIAEDDFLTQRLTYPEASSGSPAAGKRVAVTAKECVGTEVHHMLYLPENWSEQAVAAGRRWPVIVEYSGNQFLASGSTGEVEGSTLGYGYSAGQFIWVTLPFVSEDLQRNQLSWWGNEQATIDYAKVNVPKICESYGGDSEAVFLCGFSRGAIAVNYIGLHDDEIAKLWTGFISHDHYDGVLQWRGTKWGAPLEKYQSEAATRLKRINGRPVLVCQQNSTDANQKFIEQHVPLTNFTFLPVNVKQIFKTFPNEVAKHPHTDRWLIKDSSERRQAWKWMSDQLEKIESSRVKVE